MHSPSLFSLKPTASHWILSGDGWWHVREEMKLERERWGESETKGDGLEVKINK